MNQETNVIKYVTAITYWNHSNKSNLLNIYLCIVKLTLYFHVSVLKGYLNIYLKIGFNVYSLQRIDLLNFVEHFNNNTSNER